VVLPAFSTFFGARASNARLPAVVDARLISILLSIAALSAMAAVRGRKVRFVDDANARGGGG
jgi:hypothetical protein